MELVSATGANGPTHEVAKCLFSAKISITTDCKVSVNSNAETGGIVVPGLWAKETTKTYAQYQDCPSAASPVVTADDTDANIVTAVMGALNKYVYGGNKDSDLVAITIVDGVVTVANHASTPTATLIYAIKTVGLGAKGVAVVSNPTALLTHKHARPSAYKCHLSLCAGLSRHHRRC